jgi:hypothetical protein
LRTAKRDEVTGWRKLHNEELHNLYSSKSIIRMVKSKRMGWVGNVVRMGEEECVQDIDVKARRNETPKKTRSRWVENIKMNFR